MIAAVSNEALEAGAVLGDDLPMTTLDLPEAP
jgi:hypothetical protein